MSDCEISLPPYRPFLSIGFPCEILWEFLVCVFLSFNPKVSRMGICFKISCECGAFMRSSHEDCVNILVRIKGDHVLTRQVDLKVNDIRHLSMNIELIDAMACFRWRDITALCVSLDFISVIDFKRRQIWTFLNIFEEILEGPKRGGALDIDVTVKCCGKKRAEGDNPLVVDVDA